MSFNKNNPNAVGKIMGYLKQLSTDKGGEQQRRGQSRADEERLYRSRGPRYARVPSKATLSASTTSTSLATSCGSSATLVPHRPIPERRSSDSHSSDEEQETFEKTRRHFQQLRQISLGNEFKYKMEMEIKSAKDENLRNSVPFVKQLSVDSVKSKGDYSINGDRAPYPSSAKTRPYLYTQVLAAFALSMGSMIVGFASGYTSPALDTMRNSTMGITLEEETWVAGMMPLAALVGGICGGPLIDYVGRRNTITAISVPFFVGWMLIANANAVGLVFAGRALCGVCVGVGSLAFPVYLAEAVQREVRGVLGLLPTAFGNIGILISSLAGAYLDWSQLAFVGAALPVPFLALMLLIPESPNWYVARGRVDDARKALQWLRGKRTDIDREIREISLAKANSDRAAGGAALFSLKYARPVSIALGLMLFQQLTGINAVISYTKDIFKQVGSSAISDNMSAVIVTLVNFASTFLATALIDRLGRKILLYVSSVSVILTLISLGAFFYVKNVLELNVDALGWIPLASLIIYVLGFSMGFGPIPWLMMGEILPAKIRGPAASATTAFNWMSNFLVTKTFPTIIIAIGMHGAFWMFAGVTSVGLLFVIFMVPETRGRSLEEIEAKLTGAPARRVSAIANMKPLPSGL